MKILKSTHEEYSAQMKVLNRTYATDIVRAQNIPLVDARQQSKRDVSGILPKGQQTRNSYFYTIKEEQSIIGYLWLRKVHNSQLSIAHIYILAAYRSKGIGKKVMTWIKHKAQRFGCQSVVLHVFAHNHRAIAFYDRWWYYMFSRITIGLLHFMTGVVLCRQILLCEWMYS